VSIQALPGGDKQLLEAQMRAVELVIGQIEKEYVGARITIDGERSFVKTGNLIAIAIDHPESRSLDPHVHTHCLIVNATQSPTNGKWYALSNEQILADQQYLGLQYRHHLVLEVQKLGYEIQLLEGGQFEIVGYSRPQLLASSQRQQQTLELAPENPTWEQRNTARLLTRSSKQHVCEEELVRNQRARLQELEIAFVTPSQPRPDLKGTPLTPQILEEAIAHCSEYQVAFRRQDLEKYILSEHLTCDLSRLDDLIAQNTELIRTPETNRVRYTTRLLIRRFPINLLPIRQSDGLNQNIPFRQKWISCQSPLDCPHCFFSQ
ncbi:MobF family relaxase, partial [Chroococcidiopsis cubana]